MPESEGLGPLGGGDGNGLLAGKVALVTGAGRGIGRAIAGCFARQGARALVLADVSFEDSREEATEEIIRAAGSQALAERADVSDPAQVEQLFLRARERFSGIDILVNNAGVSARAQVVDMSPEEWDRIQAVNLKGQFLCSRLAATGMIAQGAGCIINISSIRARRASIGESSYIASKGGVEAFTRALALEMAGHGIRVNCIAPGAIETDINREALSDPAWRDHVLKRIPLGRLGRPDDIARVALFLASDLSTFVTGAVIQVDGGEAALG
ncbi:MAG: SDR family NAD(P)-dependent oxidoreductase [Chloroflexota bacterium]